MSKKQETQEETKEESSLIGEISIAKYTIDPEVINQGLWGPSGKPTQGVMANTDQFEKDKKRMHETKD